MTGVQMEAKQDLAVELERVTTFGSCNVRDFETAESERKEKEKKIKAERKKREAQQRIYEEERKKQEQLDYEYALEEQNLYFNVNQKSSNVNTKRHPSSTGRGQTMERLLEHSSMENNSIRSGRGRSRRSRLPQDRNIFKYSDRTEGDQYFEREKRVQNQINQLYPMDRHHSNVVQCEIWQGRSPCNQTSSPSHSSCSNQFEDASSSPLSFRNHSPWSEGSSYKSAFSSSSSSPHKASHSPDHPVSYPDPFAATSSTPCTEAFPLLPRPIKPVKKRHNKIAANFTNQFSFDDDEQNDAEAQNQDRFSVLTFSTPRPPSFRSTNNSISINSLHPSQRVLSHGQLKPENLMKSTYAKSKDGFVINNDDFPPLA